MSFSERALPAVIFVHVCIRYNISQTSINGVPERMIYIRTRERIKTARRLQNWGLCILLRRNKINLLDVRVSSSHAPRLNFDTGDSVVIFL